VIWSKETRGITLALGIGLYLLYVVQVGGDFMGGRFFSAAYLAAVVLLLVYLFPRLVPSKHWPLAVLAFAISLLAVCPPYILYPKDFKKTRWPIVSTVDERMEYSFTNFMRIDDLYAFNTNPEYHWLNRVAFLVRSVYRGTIFRTNFEHDWFKQGEEFRAIAQEEGKLYTNEGANGFTGYAAGPDVHIIQALALTDGFLSRLPPIYYQDWRSGHFHRLIPDGYLEAERGDLPGLPDPALDAYYQKIKLVTHGELFTRQRWQAIWELNTHSFTDLLPDYEVEFRFPDLTYAEGEGLERIHTPAPIAFNGIRGVGLQVELPAESHSTSLEIGLSGDDNFDLYYLDANGAILASQKLISQGEGFFTNYQLEIPAPASEQGFVAIRVLPGRIRHGLTDRTFALSFLELNDG
jgi:arabinofuranosyltransferase